MKNKLAIVIIIIISIFIHWRWVFIPKLFGGGDFSYFLKPAASWTNYLTLPSVWDPIWPNGFGSFNIILSLYPFNLGFALLSWLGVDLIWIFKALLFMPIVVFTPLFSYLLGKRISHSVVGGVVSSIIYSYNSYILLLQKGGNLQHVIAYSFVPLFFYLTSEMLEKSSYKKALLVGIVGFIISFLEFRVFYLTAILQGVYLIWYLIKEKANRTLRVFTLFILPLVITVISNSYWIVPFVFSNQISSSIATATGLFGGDMSFNKSLVFFHPYWDSGRNPTPGTVNPTPEILFLLPTLTIFAILKRKKFPELGFYLIVLCLGIFLTKQAAPPFPNAYMWLFKHFPGFNAFRESSKFYLYIALGYSQLLAIATAVLEKSRRHPLKYLPVIGLCLFLLLDTRSFVTGQTKGMFLEKSIPPTYIEFQKQIMTDKNFGRVLWVPSYSQWSVNDVTHPRVSAYLVFIEMLQQKLEAYPSFKPVVNPSDKTSHNYTLLNIFNQDFSAEYLRYLGIKYIAIPASDPIPEDDLFNNIYGLYSDREALISFFNNLTYLHKEPTYGGVDIYSLNYLPSRLYSSSNSLDFSNLQIIDPIEYQRLNSKMYKIAITNPKEAIYIHFTETMDLGWKLIDSNSILTSFSRDHKSELLGFNVFRVENNPNLALGERREMTLYYKPQQYVYFGIALSTVFLLTILWLALIQFKKPITKK